MREFLMPLNISIETFPPLVREFASYKSAIQNCSEKTVSEYLLDLRTFFRFLLARDARIPTDSEDFENIDNSLLFSRISSPYQIKILINNEEFVYKFDVFERWDTILNRNASMYVINSTQKWRIKL